MQYKDIHGQRELESWGPAEGNQKENKNNKYLNKPGLLFKI
jgi:hypothetical protein